MKTIMIIPAKAYSSRLHGKNLKSFCGTPLVEWSIIQGVKAKLIDEVWVTTDDEQIAALAEKHGAKVLIRDYKDTVWTSGSVPVQNCARRLIDAGTLSMRDYVLSRLCTTPHLMPYDVDEFVRCFRRMKELYGARSCGVGADLRTCIISRKVVEGITRSVSPECMCHNNYRVVQHLGFLGMIAVKDLLVDTRTAEQILQQEVERDKFSPTFYYRVEPWQMQDVDTAEEWEFAELVAEHYILKGRTVEEIYA